MLRVGPQSAGADPGPACYGRGGVQPTITDAHIIQGTIRPEAFLGGTMEVDALASQRVFGNVAAHFDMALPEMADSAIRLADANIVRAIQIISTERGRDPRDYVLVAFGGAGPLHAARVAEDLDIRTILVPPFAGVLSAYGLLASDYPLFETRTRRIVIEENAASIVRETAAEMQGHIVEHFRDIGLQERELSFTLTLEMRFVGQAFEVPVNIDPTALDQLTVDGLLAAFSAAHQRMYFHGGASGNPVEVVSFRLGAVSPLKQAPMLTETYNDGDTITDRHHIFDGSREVECKLTRRTGMSSSLDGPAIIDDETSTIFVPAGWQTEIDDHKNLIMRRS